MNRRRIFISFDFDHDKVLRSSFVGQAKKHAAHLNIQDWSLPGPVDEAWKRAARDRIRQSDLAIVICGKNTHSAAGVEAELTIIQQERKPYLLLQGRPRLNCSKPPNARSNDTVQKWRWKTLNDIIVEITKR